MLHYGDTAITTSDSKQDTGERNWRLQGHCLFLGEIFYPSEEETRGAKLRRERAARNICAQCPVHVICRDYALQNKEEHGVWGGLTEFERRKLGRRYRRAPRRRAAAQ